LQVPLSIVLQVGDLYQLHCYKKFYYVCGVSMRGKVFILVLCIVLCPLVVAQSESGGHILVCTISNIPYGYVIIGKTTTEQCRANVDLPERDNTWIIRAPGPREVVCDKSPYPGEYAVVGRTRLNTCPNLGNESDNNAWIINRLK
jgi:hypothetical protein